MDRLGSMRVFAKVVEQGSFARAAQALDMSATVVTRNVADLEAHLGTRLLNRTTRRLSLTETGQQYLERVRQILADIDDADAIASSSARKPGGTLRIYCHPGFGQSQLALLLPLYAQAMPDVVLDVTLADHTVDLVEEGFDVGIFIGLQKFDASMIARRLATSKVVLCASPAYLARRGTPATPSDVSSHDCLNFAFEQLRHHWPVHWENEVLNVPIVSRMVSNSAAVLRQAALAGMGIMLRSSFTLENDFESGRLVQLLQGHHLGELSVMMVYPSRRLLSAKVRSFVNFMNDQFPRPESDPWLADARPSAPG
jgi:DNA-binding transcriptional LysR family regulator